MKNLFASVSIAALLVSAPALAQSTNKNAIPNKVPAETTSPQLKAKPAANDADKKMPSDDRAQNPANMDKDGDKTAKSPAAKDKDGDKATNRAQAPTMKEGDKNPTTTAAKPTDPKAQNFGMSWRASKLIGARVYSSRNENIGDINDLIIDSSGRVAEVIIGVGGFLGMGEHNVAVPMSDLKFTRGKDNDLRISGEFTKAGLKGAPAWDKRK